MVEIMCHTSVSPTSATIVLIKKNARLFIGNYYMCVYLKLRTTNIRTVSNLYDLI